MTIKTATTLRFSSGFSIETFQLLDLLSHAIGRKDFAERIILQQYLSRSPHFHEKKGDEHIKRMIEESLGCFFHFEAFLPDTVKWQLQEIYDEQRLKLVYPLVYPPIKDLPLERIETLMAPKIYKYRLSTDADCQDMLLV